MVEQKPLGALVSPGDHVASLLVHGAGQSLAVRPAAELARLLLRERNWPERLAHAVRAHLCDKKNFV